MSVSKRGSLGGVVTPLLERSRVSGRQWSDPALAACQAVWIAAHDTGDALGQHSDGGARASTGGGQQGQPGMD
jgi:hypothetical protein